MRILSTLSLIFATLLTGGLLLTPLPFPHFLFAQEPSKDETPDEEPLKKNGVNEIADYTDDAIQEIDFYSLEELLNTRIEVASLFNEDELVVGSTVSGITAERWRMLGARRNHEALMNEMGVITPQSASGSYAVVIRGYASTNTATGVAVLIDDVPLNEVIMGTAIFHIQNWELGTLDRIEMIRGPGSAIYGSNAFHGVVSMKSFESDTDMYSFEGAGAYPLYYDGNVKISHGLYNDKIRIDTAVAASSQSDLDMKYEWEGEGAETGERGTGTRKMQYDSQSGIIKLKLKPADKIKVTISGYATRYICDDFPGAAKGPLDISLRDYDVVDNDSFSYIVKGDVIYKFENDIILNLMGYYWLGDVLAEYAVDPSGMYYFLEQIAGKTGSTITLKQPDNPLNLQWLMAYSYSRDRIIKANYWLGEKSSDGAHSPVVYEGFERKIQSAFCQFKWGMINKRLYLLGGARLDNYSDFGNQLTPRGGVIFLPTESSAVKALYGRAFRAASATEKKGMDLLFRGDPDIQPEVIDTYELNYTVKEKEWKFITSAYYSFWKNAIIVESVAGIPQYKYVNKGENKAYGGEVNLFYSFVKSFAAELGFTFVESFALDTYDKADPDTKKDVKYDAYPTYSVNAGLFYTLTPVNINFYLNNRLYMQMKEAPSSIKAQPDKLPPYYRVDLNISKSISSGMEFNLNIRNLLNRENHFPSIIGAENGYNEPGISVLLRASYKM